MANKTVVPNWAFLIVLLTTILLFSRDGVTQQRTQVELLSAKVSATQTSLELVGQVKNISGRPVEGVDVAIDFQDASGKSVQVVKGKLAKDPLPADGVSDFQVSTPYDASIKRFNVVFSTLFGGRLAMKDSRK